VGQVRLAGHERGRAPVVVDAPTAATLGASVTVPDWVLIAGGVVIVGGLGWFLRKRGIL